MAFQINRRKVRISGILTLFILGWGSLLLVLFLLQLPHLVYLKSVPTGWRQITAETYPQLGVYTMDFGDSLHGWLGGSEGLLMATLDGGVTWTHQQSGINSKIRALDFFDDETGIAIGENREILVTENGGQQWLLLEEFSYQDSADQWRSPLLYDVAIVDSTTAWILGTRVIFRIHLQNKSGTVLTEFTQSLFALDILNNTHGWATGSGGAIVRTKTGWQSYEVLDSGEPTNFMKVYFWNAQIGWVGGYDNTILATTDGGDHWIRQYRYRPFLPFSTSTFFDIEFVTAQKGWAVGTEGIHVTENSGRTWIRLPDTRGLSVVSFANETHGWAVSLRKDRSFFTATGGASVLDESVINLGFAGISFVILVGIPSLIIYRDYKKKEQNDPIAEKRGMWTSNFISKKYVIRFLGAGTYGLLLILNLTVIEVFKLYWGIIPIDPIRLFVIFFFCAIPTAPSAFLVSYVNRDRFEGHRMLFLVVIILGMVILIFSSYQLLLSFLTPPRTEDIDQFRTLFALLVLVLPFLAIFFFFPVAVLSLGMSFVFGNLGYKYWVFRESKKGKFDRNGKSTIQ